MAWLGTDTYRFIARRGGLGMGQHGSLTSTASLSLAGALGGIDVRLEEGAQSLGASPWRSFLEVTLPLSMPGVVAGSLLVFALSISAYVTPYLIGGQRVLTVPMLIYQQVSASFNAAFAGALGVVLLAVSLVLIVLYHRVLARVPGAT